MWFCEPRQRHAAACRLADHSLAVTPRCRAQGRAGGQGGEGVVRGAGAGAGAGTGKKLQGSRKQATSSSGSNVWSLRRYLLV